MTLSICTVGCSSASCFFISTLLNPFITVEMRHMFYSPDLTHLKVSCVRSREISLMTFDYKGNSEKSPVVSLNYGNTSRQSMQVQL